MTLDKNLKYSTSGIGRITDWRVDLKHRDMIRERSIAAYESMLGFPITKYAEDEVKRKGSFSWVDMCCGNFDAGRGLTYNLYQSGKKEIVKSIEAIGVDVNTFMNDSRVDIGMHARIEKGNVVDYILPQNVDLVTCVRGLRYVEEYLKQGALAVQNWFNQLPCDGILLFDTYNDHPLTERGDEPVMAGERELTQALRGRLGDSVQTYTTHHQRFTSFVVNVRKQKNTPLNLV